MQWFAKLSISYRQKKKRKWFEFDESIILVNGVECHEIIADRAKLRKKMNLFENVRCFYEILIKNFLLGCFLRIHERFFLVNFIIIWTV